MRIAGGHHKGKRLRAPTGSRTRPTSGLARDALFTMLTHGRLAAEGDPVHGARVLDAFAGSGGMGLEALSRGASEAVFLEHGRDALRVLRRNLDELGETGRAQVVRGDATRPPRARSACQLAVLDPPYGRELAAAALTALHGAGWFAPGGVVVLEVGKTESPELPVGIEVVDTRVHGKAKLVLLRISA